MTLLLEWSRDLDVAVFTARYVGVVNDMSLRQTSDVELRPVDGGGKLVKFGRVAVRRAVEQDSDPQGRSVHQTETELCSST